MAGQTLKLLIFDLDGTLVDSRFDLGDAVNYALARLGLPPCSYEEMPPLLGSGLGHLLRTATGFSDAAALAQARHYFDEYYGRHHADKTRCYPGVQETLAALGHLRKAVLSNKAQAFTGAIIDRLGLSSFFDLVLGADPGRYALKPDPAGINFILQTLKIAPEHALIVGDSTHDMEAGHGAGIHTCAVTWGYRPADQLARTNPDIMIDRFSQLTGLCGKDGTGPDLKNPYSPWPG